MQCYREGFTFTLRHFIRSSQFVSWDVLRRIAASQ
jgi:hypothetical protein